MAGAALLLLLVELFLFWPPAEGENLVPAASGVIGLYEPFKTAGQAPAADRYLLVDPILQMQPWLKHSRQELAAGRMPLWNHLNGFGQPFFANPQVRLAYPPQWILFLASDETSALIFFYALHVFIGGMGLVFLLSRFDVGFPGLALGSISFACLGYNWLWIFWPHHSTLAWIPWLLFACDLILTRLSAKAFLLLVVSAWLMLLGGHPESSFKGAVVAWLFTLGRLIGGRVKRPFKAIMVMSAGMLMAFALAAFQLFPFIEYLVNGEILQARADNPAYPPLTSLAEFLRSASVFLTHLVSPDFHGDAAQPAHWWLQKGNYNEISSIYCGLAVLVFSPFAFLRKNRLRPALILIVGFALVVVFRVPLLYDLLFQVPGFDVGANNRFVSMSSMGMCMAAGLGLDRLLRNRRYFLRPTPLCVVFGWLLFLAVVSGYEWFAHPPELDASLLYRSQFGTRLLLFSGLAVLALATTIFLPKSTLGLCLVATLLGADLYWHTNEKSSWVPAAELWPSSRSTQFMQEECSAEKGRIICIGLAFPAELNLGYGLAFLDSYSAIQPWEESRFLAFAGTPVTANGKRHDEWWPGDQFKGYKQLDLSSVRFGYSAGDFSRFADRPADFRMRLGDGAQVQGLFACKEGVVYERVGARPRAWLCNRSILGESWSDFTAAKLLANDVFLSADYGLNLTGKGRGEVHLQSYQSDKVVLLADVELAAQVLVLSDRYSPEWEVYVNGDEAQMLRVNGIFRGVLLKPGRNQVEFRWRWTPTYLLGFGVSLLALMSLLFVLLRLKQPRSTS